MHEKKAREVCCIGWDGVSNPIYRYRDELSLPDYERSRPTADEVEALRVRYQSPVLPDGRFSRGGPDTGNCR